MAKRAPITKAQLHNWKLLDRFRQEVLPLLEVRPATATEQDKRRTLFAEDYFCAFLFAMLNPVVRSLRAFCHASHCRKMRQVCSAPISPAAFSAAQHLFAPEVLDQVVRQLAKQALGQDQGGDARTRQALAALTAVDGTLLRAVPRMAWAPAAGPSHAVRLHLHFSVFDQVPEAWTITPGNVCERKVFHQTVQPGAMVVADRYFSQNHALLETCGAGACILCSASGTIPSWKARDPNAPSPPRTVRRGWCRTAPCAWGRRQTGPSSG